MLFRDEVVPVASPRLLARFGAAQVLKCAPLIHLDWGNEGRFLPDWRSWLQAKGLEATPFNLTSLAIDAAVAGAGLLLGQRRLIAAELARGDLIIVDELSLPLSKPYYLAWPSRSVNQPGSNELMRWLSELAGL